MDVTFALSPIAVLADPTRARILQLMLAADDGRARVGPLAETLGLRQPTVSHHMKVLLDAGVVEREPTGRVAWYSIAPEQAGVVAVLLGEPGELQDAGATAPPAEPDCERISADLAVRFRGVFAPETIDALVRESRDLLADRTGAAPPASRVAAFAAFRLEAVARADAPTRAVPEVLFVCRQNAGRSQLAAAGILRQLAGDRVVVRSAGVAPAPQLRASIVSALEEIGVGIGGEFPKPLTDDALLAADVVITMGCGDACPVRPGRRYLDWDLEDPAGKPAETVRAIRDDIDLRVRALLTELLETTS